MTVWVSKSCDAGKLTQRTSNRDAAAVGSAGTRWRTVPKHLANTAAVDTLPFRKPYLSPKAPMQSSLHKQVSCVLGRMAGITCKVHCLEAHRFQIHSEPQQSARYVCSLISDSERSSGAVYQSSTWDLVERFLVELNAVSGEFIPSLLCSIQMMMIVLHLQRSRGVSRYDVHRSDLSDAVRDGSSVHHTPPPSRRSSMPAFRGRASYAGRRPYHEYDYISTECER